jgi:hypothetical protein
MRRGMLPPEMPAVVGLLIRDVLTGTKDRAATPSSARTSLEPVINFIPLFALL